MSDVTQSQKQRAKAPRLTDAIPDPQIVRDQLGETLREAGVLRHLLRVAERAHRQRLQREQLQKGASHG